MHVGMYVLHMKWTKPHRNVGDIMGEWKHVIFLAISRFNGLYSAKSVDCASQPWSRIFLAPWQILGYYVFTYVKS